jgi:hypothetical protein
MTPITYNKLQSRIDQFENNNYNTMTNHNILIEHPLCNTMNKYINDELDDIILDETLHHYIIFYKYYLSYTEGWMQLPIHPNI